MAYEVPSDLIKQVQILLRKEAGLECYKPGDSCSSSLPDRPTLEEAIAKLDPSPHHLRCKHCSGKLLRGVQSIICLYCGREQEKELPPQSLSFKSTVGFRWLLESLGLDGSEVVVLPAEGTQTNKGQTVSNNETLLSDFLDLEMKWPDEMERFGISVASEAEMHGKRFLNLAGVVSGNFFPEAGRGTVPSISSEEFDPNETSKSKESTAIQGQGNASLFENQQSSRAAVKAEVELGDSFSVWAADFQSARSGTKHEDFKSPDSLEASAIDYGSQMNSVFVSVKDLKERRPADVSSSHVSGNNWIANDPGSNSNSGESTQAMKPGANIELQDNRMVSKSDNPPSTSFDWFQENQQQSSSSDLPEGVRIGDDLYNESKDFKRSTGEYVQWENSGAIVPDHDKSRVEDGVSDAWADFTSSRAANDTQQQTTSETVGEDTFDAWNDFTSLSIVKDNESQTRCRNSSDGKAASLGDYSADAWSNFTSMSAHQTPQKAVGERNQDDALGLWDDYTSSVTERDHGQGSGAKLTANDATKKLDSTFGAWSDFSSVEWGIQPEISRIEVADSKMVNEGHISDVWDDFMSLSNAGNNVKQINTMKAFENTGIGESDSLVDAWNDFKSSTNASDNQTIRDSSTSMGWNNLASLLNQQQTSREEAPENKMIVENDDLFNSWSDFRSSGNAADINPSSSTPVSDNWTISKDILLSSPIPQASQQQTGSTKALENMTAIEPEDLFNTWRDLRNEASIADDQWQTNGAEVSENKMTSEGDNIFGNGLNDRFSNLANTLDNQLKSSGTALVDNKITSANEFSLDDGWTDFTNSSNMQQNHFYNTSTNAPDAKETVKHAGPLDAWDVFTSSSGKIGNHPVASQQHSSEENLLSAASNSQGVGLSTSWQQDMFSGALSNQGSSAPSDILPPEVSFLFRMNDENNAKAEATTEKGQESEEISQETSNSKSNDAESLILQMHDLSFMLESSLSIPKR